jgi:hypothetical protein
VTEPFPPNPRDVIHPHRLETVGFLLATRPPCTRIVVDEVRNVKRTLKALGPGDIPPSPLPRSWVLALLVCPGDTLEGIATWVRRLPARDRERVYLFFHPDVDRVAALASWYEAGLDDPIVSLAHDFRSFHKSFGARMNLQTYLDFR